MTVQARTDASKERKGRAEALALAKTMNRIVVSTGKKTVTLNVKKGDLDDDALAGYLLGPTGNLRAPTLRVGKTLFVGFNEEAYRNLLAK